MHLPFLTRGMTHALAFGATQQQASTASQQADIVPGTVCTQSLKSAPGPTANCGFPGTLANPSKLGGSLKLDSRDNCTTACFQQAGCQAFQLTYGPFSYTCQLYAKNLAGMGYKSSATNSPTSYYNKACFSQSCPNLAANNGNFEQASDWSPFSTSGQGLEEAIIKPGFKSKNAGGVVLTNDAANFDSLTYSATYPMNITANQLYSISFDYKPNVEGCLVTAGSLTGYVYQFLQIGSYGGLVGQPATVGQWSHYVATGLFDILTFNQQQFGVGFQMICPGLADNPDTPSTVAAFDNFVVTPLSKAPYDSSTTTTGANLIKNPSFEVKGAQGYTQSKNASTAAVKTPGFYSNHRLEISFKNITTSNPPSFILSQTIPTVANNVYWFSIGYETTANVTCQLFSGLLDSRTDPTDLFNLGSVQTFGLISTAAVVLNMAPTDGFQTTEGFLISNQDDQQLFVFNQCLVQGQGAPVSLSIDGLNLYATK